MSKHDHDNCKHENLKHCKKCDVIECDDCDKEWGVCNWTYPVTTPAPYNPYDPVIPWTLGDGTVTLLNHTKII